MFVDGLTVGLLVSVKVSSGHSHSDVTQVTGGLRSL